MNWNQPMCDVCWKERNPGRFPYRIVAMYRKLDQCAWCGEMTESGILVREHPDRVSFPAPDEEEPPSEFRLG